MWDAGKSLTGGKGKLARLTELETVLGEESARGQDEEEMLAELDRVQGRQCHTTGRIQASKDQLMPAENMFEP